MFDFFAVYDPKSGVEQLGNSVFCNIPAYSMLEYKENYIHCKDLTSVYLERNKPEHPDVFHSDKYTVFIFGYLFLKDEKSSRIKCRMSASQIVEWLEAGNKIDHENFKGSYSILIVNHSKPELQIITDPLNVRSVFYTFSKDRYLISTSLDAMIAFLQFTGENPRINKVAFLQQYLFDFILDDTTLVEGILQVPPGYCLTFSYQGINKTNYFDILTEFRIKPPVYSPKESIQKLNNYLKEHLDNYSDESGQTAMALTGGYDSRLLASLLGNKAKDVAFYSYGHPDSWDIRIPARIAADMKWSYETYQFGESFATQYGQNTELALSLTAGTALFTQADIPYIYSNHLRDKSAIISGLFGSELLKYPSGRGLVVNENMLSLLFSTDPENTLKELFDASAAAKYLGKDNKQFRDEFIHSWLSNPMLNSIRGLDKTQKFFYYLINWGARKYFAKEISMERPFVENLHPFWDPGFIRLLLQTPYSWVHMPWTNKKSAITNLKLHSLYAKLIYANSPKLAGFISTHATRPLYLSNQLYLPLLLADYKLYRSKIKKQTFSYSRQIIINYLEEERSQSKVESEGLEQRDRIKLTSMLKWFKLNNLS